MSVHGSGSNLHRQLQRDEHARTLQFLSFVDAEAVKAGRVVAVSDCQVLLQCAPALSDGQPTEHKQPSFILTGFPLDPQASDSENASLLAELARSMSAEDLPRLLGRTAFAAYLTEQGTIRELAGKKRESSGARYADAAMDSHGRVLAIEAGARELLLFANLDALLAGSAPATRLVCPGPHVTSSSSRIYSGAAHFLVHISSDVLYGLGDNRHFQQGHSYPSSWTELHQVDSFHDLGSDITKIAMGDLHSVVLTQGGGAYMLGSDAKGQSGGFSAREPVLVELPDEEEDVIDIACGSNQTLLLTNRTLYATGSNHVGQLGLCDTEDRSTLAAVELPFSVSRIEAVHAAGWTSYLQVSSA